MMQTWNNRDKKVSWTAPVTDLPCIVTRGDLGNLCGYVGVEPDHPWHGKSYLDISSEITVHGGVTYSAPCQEGYDPSIGVCHTPEKGKTDDVWWFGFDCAHANDLVPTFLTTFRGSPLGVDFPEAAATIINSGIYRDLRYVQDECAMLAHQLHRIKNRSNVKDTINCGNTNIAPDSDSVLRDRNGGEQPN